MVIILGVEHTYQFMGARRKVGELGRTQRRKMMRPGWGMAGPVTSPEQKSMLGKEWAQEGWWGIGAVVKSKEG